MICTHVGGAVDWPELDTVPTYRNRREAGRVVDEMTARIIRAIETDTGCLKILGHLTGRLLLRREGYAVSHRRVIEAAAANGKILVRLEVDDALPGGLAIYGERFGRYPLDPSVIFAIK